MLRPFSRVVRRSLVQNHCIQKYRFSSVLNIPGVDDGFEPKPPPELTTDMAEGIVDATQFYVRHGIAHQRFLALAQAPDVPAVSRWQKMMEIYLMAQAHVIAGLGYTPNESGLSAYANQLRVCIQGTDETMRKLFDEVRRETWREVVGVTFQLDPAEIPALTIEEARKVMHKVSTKMVDPDVLLKIQKETAKVPGNESQVVMQEKHKILQDVMFNDVYLSGDPSLVEETGFGAGAQGYAKLQCALTDHEGDPLLAEYATSSMMRLLEAAGIDVNEIAGASVGKEVS